MQLPQYIERKGFTIRKSYLQDIEELRGLFEIGFGKSFSKEYFEWKYLSYPLGKAVVYNVLDEEQKPICTYSAIPVEYLFNGKPIKIILAIDTTTHPDYRGKGLFSLITSEICNDLSNEHQTFIIGYPAPISFRAFIKNLGWKHLADVKVLFLPYSRLRPYIQRISSLFKKTPIQLQEIQAFDEKIDTYFANKKNYNVPIVKKYTSHILNWHTFNSQPQEDFRCYYIFLDQQLIGFLIFLERDKHQVELIKLDFIEDHFYELFTDTISRFITVKTGARIIYMWNTQNQVLKDALTKTGFIINYDNPNQFGTHSYPVTVYAQQSRIAGVDIYGVPFERDVFQNNIEGVDIFDGANFELDIFTRDFV